jgi:hypothetical protein
MGTTTAHCHCGALQALCRGEPIRVSLCHCLACKVRSGSAFSYNATFPADAVTTEGEASAWERTSEEGYRSRGFFCPRCGSTVWFEIERRPGMISLPAGAFAVISRHRPWRSMGSGAIPGCPRWRGSTRSNSGGLRHLV